MDAIFLRYSAEKLRQLGQRIDDCLGKLNDEQIWLRHSDAENSVGNLVLHLCGNLRQWIGFGVAGLPDVRVRDREFQARGGVTRDELQARLAASLDEAIIAIGKLDTAGLMQITKIQSYEISKFEAIYHVVEHFSGHAGQIIFATKLFTSSDLGYYKHLKSATHGESVP